MLAKIEHTYPLPAMERLTLAYRHTTSGKIIIDPTNRVNRSTSDGYANHDVPGGSTLATQIEKYRHSPAGRTSSGTRRGCWSSAG